VSFSVASIARERGRALGVVALLAAVAALVPAAASGAGDPVASGVFKLRLDPGFKAQLAANGVKMKPRSPRFKRGSLDPSTGEGRLRLTGLTFLRGAKKVVYGNLKATIDVGGAIGGSGGKLFDVSRGKVTRVGFGARVAGVRVRLPRSTANRLNRRLGIGSLHPGKVGGISFAEQPRTVAVEDGTATVIPFLPPVLGGPVNGVAAKIQFHCIDPFVGVGPIAPATLIGQTFHFPVAGGTIGPKGTDGVVQLAGGVRLANGDTGDPTFQQPPGCPDVSSPPGPGVSTSYLEQTNLAPNFALLNVQANAFLGGTLPGCWAPNDPAGCGVIAGDKGIAIGQTIDMSKTTVRADPNANPMTVTISGAVIKNNGTSSLVLNGLFPNGTTDPARNFADGDLFGTANLTLEVR
jgi:hypothetical protein